MPASFTPLHSRCGSIPVQPVVVERATIKAYAIKRCDELSSGDAPVDRGVASIGDGAIQPRGSLHVGVEEGRHGDPRGVFALVGQDPVLHAPELVIADKLRAHHQS